jgi:hypothetical protein
METLGNLKRKRGQLKPRRRRKRGRPFCRRTVALVLGLAPLLTALVTLVIEIIKHLGP